MSIDQSTAGMLMGIGIGIAIMVLLAVVNLRLVVTYSHQKKASVFEVDLRPKVEHVQAP